MYVLPKVEKQAVLLCLEDDWDCVLVTECLSQWVDSANQSKHQV